MNIIYFSNIQKATSSYRHGSQNRDSTQDRKGKYKSEDRKILQILLSLKLHK